MASFSDVSILPSPAFAGRALLPHHYALLLILVLAPLIYRSLFSTLPFSANPWIALHMSYADFGFVKRGLVATLMDIAGLQGRTPIITYTVICVAAFVYLFTTCAQTIARSAEQNLQWWLLLFLVLNPLTLFNTSWDCGRSDVLSLLLFIASLRLADRSTVLAAAVVCIGMLHHEIHAVLWLPPLLLKLLLMPGRHPATALAPLVFLPALTFALLFMYGRYENGADALAQLQLALAGHADTGIWTRSLADNFSLCMSIYRHANFLTGYLIPIMYFIGCIYVVVALVRPFPMKARLVLQSPLLAVIPLSLVGLDVFRWMSLAFISVILLIGDHMRNAIVRTPVSGTTQLLLLGLLIAGFAMGPIGVHEAFPLQKRLF